MSALDTDPRAIAAARAAWDELPPIERLGGDVDRHFPPACLIRDLLRDVELQDLGQIVEVAKPLPIRATCSTELRALRSSGTRRLSAIELLVVHTTEGLTARGAARWFTNPACRGSAHVVADGIECFRTLPPSAIPWGAPGANGRGWHLEIVGRASWARAEWLRHPSTIERAAFKLAWHGRAFKIPIVRLTDAELRAGVKRGVVDHRQCSRVFGGTHWDVGDGFPFDRFLQSARAWRRELS